MHHPQLGLRGHAPSVLPRVRRLARIASTLHAVEAHEDRLVWLRRLRWRLRGAWSAPAFVLFTIADALLLRAAAVLRRPRRRDRRRALAAAILNLVMVAVVGPLIGLWLRRRDARLPAFAARDRAGVFALAA